MDRLISYLPLIADAVVVVAFFCLMVLRGERGLSESLLPLAATVLAAAGALILTAVLRERVAEAVYPWLRDQVLSRMDLSSIRSRVTEDILSQLERLLPDSVSRVAARLGLEVRDFVAKALGETPYAAGARIAEDAVSALMLPITDAVVRVGLMIVSFIVLRVVLGLIFAAIGIIPQLPILRWIDHLAGALLGFVECLVLLWLVCRAIRLSGFEPLLEILEKTRLISGFLSTFIREIP